MEKTFSVAFLWHMHQPMYKDLVTGRYHLPWIRLHSTYSYLDMPSILEEFPDIKATFNLTPSLIWQLRDMSSEERIDDVYLDLSEKAARELTEEDKCFLLKNFFSCDMSRGDFPLKRYKDLFLRRGEDLKEAALRKKIKNFSNNDFRDLQVFFNLIWCGFTLRKKDGLVKELMHKGHGYREDEKKALLGRQKEVVGSIIPLYKRLQDEGRIEISTSPFYHPIMPLLCRGRSKEGFDFRQDLEIQVSRAVELCEEVFGRKPAGMWPSEGSVSQDIIPVMAENGIKWIATDEGILQESFKGEGVPRDELIYKAFTVEENGRKLDMVFRDINISNAISFRYASLAAEKASGEMLEDIRGIARVMETREGEHVAAVILDGENPWPYYPDGGKKFLSEVYGRLSSEKDIKTVTVGGYLASHGERKKIDKLYAGSWIDRNFRKWIGSPQKNKAWEYLEKTRKELLGSGRPDGKALEELYIAEGSDWFWWYDDFGSELNFVFDDLFRLHLANVYRIMGRKVPHYLEKPIIAGPTARKLPEAAGPMEMARYPKVLFVSSEVFPFSKTGGLADVSASLPGELASLGCEVRVMTPFYRCVAKGRFGIERETRRIKGEIMGRMPGFDLYSRKSGGVITYFIANRKYFARRGLYGSSKGDYRDNGLRFGFFARAVLAALKAVNFKPDVIHCNDWQTALIPFYLMFGLREDDLFRDAGTLFTIHNMAYQGVFSKKIMKKLGIPERLFNMNDLEFYGKVNFMKSGILYSDAVSTVSHKYAEEIMTPEYGCGLDGLLRTRKDVLYGIPNGVDYSVWSPKADRFISDNYDAGSVDKKLDCKRDLLDHVQLKVPLDKPLLGCVTRLAEQKGMDLLAGIVEKIVQTGAGMVVLGRGSRYYNNLFHGLARKYPQNVYACSDFNDELAHKIEAGCDIFVMPSRYEPCGLNHMYSIKYGTIPVVRATGGLDDVIIDFDEDRDHGNGFKFGPAEGEALLKAIKRAVDVYGDKGLWRKLMVQAMGYDFSWARSAKQYLQLYKKIMEERTSES